MKQRILGKAVLSVAGAAFVAAAFVGSALFVPIPQAEAQWVFIKEQPSLAVSPLPVPYKAKAKVMIAGSGFEPKQEVNLQIAMGGVPSDISFLVKPRPVANQYGAFASEWILAGEIRRKLLEPTAYTLQAVDENGFVIAQTALVFMAEKKAAKKK